MCATLNKYDGAHAFEVLVCQTGGDALATVAQRADIALVLLDMILPDTNGLQVLQQLQRTRPELPVVMLSGLGSESDVVVGLEMGADDYIAKPFSSRVVVARVKAVLRRSGALASEAPGVAAGLADQHLKRVRAEHISEQLAHRYVVIDH